MSGGHWCHQNAEIEHIADECDYIRDMLYKVSETAHIIDYAESCDTSKTDARKELYNLWKDFFEKRYTRR